MPPPSNLQGALLGLVAMGLFACGDITIKVLGSGYNPFQIIFFAALMSVPLLAGYAMADTAPATLRPVRPRLMALRCIFMMIQAVLGTYAFSTLPLAQCYAIFFTMPIFITLFSALLLGEKIDLVRGLAVIIGMIGVFVALDPEAGTLQWAHLAALCGAVLGAGTYVIIRMSGSRERSVVMILYPNMLQLVVAAVALPFVYTPMSLMDLSLTALMAVTSFVGYLAIISAYRRTPGIVVSPMQYSQIIWAAIFGALLFGEVMTNQTIVGVVLIAISGIAIVAKRERAA